jgi:hypothetical protein
LGAEAKAILDGVNFSDSDTSSSAASAVVEGDEHTGRGAAEVGGKLAVSAGFFGANGIQASISGGSSWTDSFSGPRARFDFFIPEAAIGFEANNVNDLFGSVFVEILLNGVRVFSAGADVRALAGTPRTPDDVELTQTGTTDLVGSFATDIAPSFGLGGAGYGFAAFTGSLDLLGDVGTNLVEYRMSSLVEGLIGETSALAFVGDPLNLSQQPGGVSLTPGGDVPTVPEPAPIWLMLMGLAALAGKLVRSQRIGCTS